VAAAIAVWTAAVVVVVVFGLWPEPKLTVAHNRQRHSLETLSAKLRGMDGGTHDNRPPQSLATHHENK